MKLTRLALPEVVLIEPTLFEDQRGAFARTYCSETFEKAGLESAISQCSISYNTHAGTLRGMHLQIAPHEEAKLVRCTSGAIYDVAVDVRRGSPTFGNWVSATLSAGARNALFIPRGFAHGFLTLEPATEVFYQISTAYAPDHARGFLWNDPDVGIAWPTKVEVISEKDVCLPPLSTMHQDA